MDELSGSGARLRLQVSVRLLLRLRLRLQHRVIRHIFGDIYIRAMPEPEVTDLFYHITAVFRLSQKHRSLTTMKQSHI